MRFKLMKAEDAVEPIAWRSLAPPPSSQAQSVALRPAPVASAPSHRAAVELPVPSVDLEELERRHQSALVSARQDGYMQGLQQARSEAAAELKAINDRVAQTLADLAGTKKRIRQESEQELLKLSLAIARRILFRELLSDPEALHGVVHAALQKLQNREISRVRVFPAGADPLRKSLERIGAAPAIEIYPDPALKVGDLIFETAFGELDASIDTQLLEIQRGFADRLAIR
jgi:flagellar assembly protein FliH